MQSFEYARIYDMEDFAALETDQIYGAPSLKFSEWSNGLEILDLLG